MADVAVAEAPQQVQAHRAAEQVQVAHRVVARVVAEAAQADQAVAVDRAVAAVAGQVVAVAAQAVVEVAQVAAEADQLQQNTK